MKGLIGGQKAWSIVILFVANLYCEIYCNGERGVLHIVDGTTANKIKDEIDWCDLQGILQYPKIKLNNDHNDQDYHDKAWWQIIVCSVGQFSWFNSLSCD